MKLSKKNQILTPFENTDQIEDLALKNKASLFLMSSDTKKRPMNLIFGSLFNHKILDMFEFEVTNFIPGEYFETVKKIDMNSQPVMVFLGEPFETTKNIERFKFYMMDFYKQDSLEEVNISDLNRIIVFSCDEKQCIRIRHYQMNLPVLEYSIDRISFEEIGPSFDLQPRRTNLSEDDDFRTACKQPKLLNKENKKKINSLIDVKAKVFPTKQNLNAISLKRYDKILGKKRKINSSEVKEKA